MRHVGRATRFVARMCASTVENRIFIPSTVPALKLAAALETRVEALFWLAKE